MGKCAREVKVKDLLRKGGHNNHYFVLCSSTDIDRLASFHKACLETGSKFMVDGYQKSVLDIFTKYAGAKSSLYDFSETLVKGCKFASELLPYSFIIPVRTHDIKFIQDFKKKHCPDAQLIYSMWEGYINGSEDQQNQDILNIVNKVFHGHHIKLHTSGHADMETLEKVCRYTKPRIGIISIHHDPRVKFSELIKTQFQVIEPDTDLTAHNIEYFEEG